MLMQLIGFKRARETPKIAVIAILDGMLNDDTYRPWPILRHNVFECILFSILHNMGDLITLDNQINRRC